VAVAAPPLGLACGIVAMLAVVVLPPAAWLPGGAAIVLGR
jgi:hypothetical protein